MSSKPAATRTSSRTKTPTTAIPTATRLTRTRTATVKTTTPSDEALTSIPTKKPTGRKPLVNKDNSIDAPQTLVKSKAKSAPLRKGTKQNNGAESEREPIMAFLRIRPPIGDEDSSSPYLTPISDISVNMTDPQDHQTSRSKYRFSTAIPSSIYTFSHVFPFNTTQSDFFTKTTLPLVKDILVGQNGLLFTYGVTNSGKTYTVQGGGDKGAAGILPRSLDVIFNSIEGLHGDGRYRPVRLHGVELADDHDSVPPPTMPEPALADVLGPFTTAEPEFDIDPTVVQVDRNYEYSIWISYAEVYNEKVYDLLASVKDESNGKPENGPFRPATSKPLLLSRQALPLKQSPTSDSVDSESTGKYIAGLRQFRVHSAAQAKALVKLGQLHRRVFGTLANSESSRSHGMVIIKVVRGHRGDPNNPTSLQISRLTLVDLAGSERTKHTHTTGDRLKEAGNINKSLMVLGQCMEVMRSNQRKIAASLSSDSLKDGRMDTRDIKKGLAVVPFRHSKLTEALMDYFVGDGRTVMIVNVNPYDTGYDENSHVMKFAALAKEVYVTPAPAPVQRVPIVGPGNVQGKKIKSLGPLTLNDPDIVPRPFTRKVTISMANHDLGKKPVEAILEVREDDEPHEDPDREQDDDPINPLVDALFDEVEHLRLQLFESEMRCALIEAETREEVMREMEERMRMMEEMYSRRLMSELEANEMKTDAKIDMLHQSGLFGSPTKASRHVRTYEDFSEEEEDVEMSLIDYRTENPDEGSENDRVMSVSPLERKAVKKPKKSTILPQPIIEKRTFVPDPPMLPSDTEDAQLTDTENGEISSAAPSHTTISEMDDEDEECEEDEEEDEDYLEDEDEEDEDEDEWGPISKTPRRKKVVTPNASPSPSTTKSRKPFVPVRTPRVSKLTKDMDGLHIKSPRNGASVTIVPNKKSGKIRQSEEAEEDEAGDDDDLLLQPTAVKKKKRIINKTAVMTEEDIEKATYNLNSEKKIGSVHASGTIRRLGKH